MSLTIIPTQKLCIDGQVINYVLDKFKVFLGL